MKPIIIILLMALSTHHLHASDTIRYVALGDSYTICEGVATEDRWPNVLTKHLNEAGIPVELVANPSVTGWTTQDLIDKELPIYKSSRPDFATLLIGVNDWVQQVPAEKFKENLYFIIDAMRAELDDSTQMVLIDIPDFGVTPQGAKYGKGRNIHEGIKSFNAIIAEAGAHYGIPVVSVFETSLDMANDDSLIWEDGLHPSAKEYALWEALILPVVQSQIKQ